MNNRFKYTGERDKSMGVAGMAISLAVWHARDLLVSVSLDGDTDSTIVLSSHRTTSTSPKALWESAINDFQLSTALLLGNVICRSYAAHHELSNRDIHELEAIVCESGHDVCDLDDDESLPVFRKCYAYFDRLFAHNVVQRVASDLSAELVHRRSMDASEVFDMLHELDRL